MSTITKLLSDRKKLKSLASISIYVALMVIAAVVFSKYIDRESLQALVQNSGGLGIVVYFLIEVVYVLPLTPDDELTYIVAAGPIGFKRFILPIFLGTLAKSAYSYIGDMGTRGIVIATYARLILLVVGLIAVGLQERFLLKKRTG